ncbi:hypothetical protein B0T24DRAFT_697209 [Lasiosphaeria ovina]|uniref:Uncharacterized protein n=1 Tax=Lasiosphaeria ovina TaxID=92902 RepID=A0AAE0TUT5_9PEZI|nr:hypothetical protein B0T24DRAFT_697209 [Lasiosphaeria ovina]
MGAPNDDTPRKGKGDKPAKDNHTPTKGNKKAGAESSMQEETRRPTMGVNSPGSRVDSLEGARAQNIQQAPSQDADRPSLSLPPPPSPLVDPADQLVGPFKTMALKRLAREHPMGHHILAGFLAEQHRRSSGFSGPGVATGSGPVAVVSAAAGSELVAVISAGSGPAPSGLKGAEPPQTPKKPVPVNNCKPPRSPRGERKAAEVKRARPGQAPQPPHPSSSHPPSPLRRQAPVLFIDRVTRRSVAVVPTAREEVVRTPEEQAQAVQAWKAEEMQKEKDDEEKEKRIRGGHRGNKVRRARDNKPGSQDLDLEEWLEWDCCHRKVGDPDCPFNPYNQ